MFCSATARQLHLLKVCLSFEVVFSCFKWQQKITVTEINHEEGGYCN